MDLNFGFTTLFLLLVLFVGTTISWGALKDCNIRNYGATGDGYTDDTKAILAAWRDACNFEGGKSRVYIPDGTYLINTVSFTGPCKSPIAFSIIGILKAPPGLIQPEAWISFKNVNHMVLKGGTLDAQGAEAWQRNDCNKNPNCRQLPITLAFAFVNKARVLNIQSLNSKNTHFSFYSCNHLNISHVNISAPANSPNTDGIKIGSSRDIQITKSTIQTGDDCIAILSGNRDIDISEVSCGPGHGISVGSLGKYNNEKDVKGLRVSKSTFTGTSDGVRIKTWAKSASSIVASNLTFEDLTMDNVFHPITIDQNYCPHGLCNKGSSQIQIKDVTFDNIRGTSSSNVAVNLQCSNAFPCQNVIMRDINLVYDGDGGATSSCNNVNGKSYGLQQPAACI